jgi:uncharacterized protein (TIGR02646 family)
MKHVVKGSEPASFQRWKRQNPHEANWSNLDSAVRQELKETLIEQQKEMCCYCEVSLKQSTNVHVEHLEDKHNWPNRIFDYDNLLASCQYNDSCGHKKGAGYFSGMVSPLDDKCESRFTYTGIGTMIPTDETDVKAQSTIDLLGLNCNRLKGRRKAIIQALETDGYDFYSLQQILDSCIDWPGGFFTVIKYMRDKIN